MIGGMCREFYITGVMWLEFFCDGLHMVRD